MMIAIKCKSGNTFSACVKEYSDADFEFQQIYYKAQGCIVEQQESVTLKKCECDHCKTLDHHCDDLINRIREL